ncbi:MAG: ATP-grasp domain-containing protein [Candidatus Komeilibacteria bacterium]|nr:ATP-grasp domain-containing protein [Candidatus Komeilibacteria bacterium]
MENKESNGLINGEVLIGKTILLVNTGSLKKRFIIQRIKKLGLTVVALNKEKNWAEPYVDHWILADTANHTEAIQAIRSFLADNPAVKIEGVITFWEDDVLLTSKIADKFNFTGIPYVIAKKVRNKYLFRRFCFEHGIKSPQHLIIKSAADLETVGASFSFPVVIKPVYGASSAYVIKANDKEELLETYNYIKKNISVETESALNDGLDILVEEYIDGDEVDVDILLQNGKVKFYSISDNYKTKEPFFLETGFSIPSNLPEACQQDLIDLAEETLEKIGVYNGCVHFEAKSTKTGAVPIEINLRMGGDEVYSFVKGVWNVDLIEQALKIALGLFIKIKKPATPRKYFTGQDFLSEHSGILVKVNIKEEVRKKSYLEELHFFKQIGDPVFVPPDGYEYLGWLTVSGDNLLDATDNLNEALKSIEYEVARFHSASSIGKTTRKSRFSFSALNKDILVRGNKIEKVLNIARQNLRNLHIGIACNLYNENNSESAVEADLSAIGLNIEKTLKERGYKVTFFDFNDMAKAFNELKDSDVDLVFNVCERINNSSLLEPHAAAILDALRIPYTGSNPFTLGLCIDKIRVKKLLSYHKIPTPDWDYVYTMEDEIREDLHYPLIVKPANTDNSIGITNESVVTNKEELTKQLKHVIEELGHPALIEEYIEGDEYDVSIIGSDEHDLRVLPLSRSIFDDLPQGLWHIYPFEAKFVKNSVYKQKIVVQRPPKNILNKLESLLSEIALDTYNILDCHDYGRVEIRVDKNNNPYVLELNPNPSIDLGDCLPEVAQLMGMSYGDFLEEIIRMAIERYKNNPPYYHLQGNII